MVLLMLAGLPRLRRDTERVETTERSERLRELLEGESQAADLVSASDNAIEADVVVDKNDKATRTLADDLRNDGESRERSEDATRIFVAGS